MEEDIKLIEDFLLGKKMQYGSGYIGFKEFIAIENLIKDYKDLHLAYELYKSKNENLEEENKELKNNYINPSKARISYYDTKKGTEIVIEGFIPILVIQNEIDKLGNMLQETMEGKIQKYTPGEIIFLKRFLENLLEERN